MKKRQKPGAKTGKTRQKRVPKKTNPIHEWDRRLLQAGYVVPAERTPHTLKAKLLAIATVGIIFTMIVLAVYAVSLATLEPNPQAPWQEQNSPTARK